MGMQHIDSQTVQDPEMLCKVLTEMNKEIGQLRVMANELKTISIDLKTKYEDHRHSVAGDASVGTKPSTVGATAGAVASTISQVTSPTVTQKCKHGN